MALTGFHGVIIEFLKQGVPCLLFGEPVAVDTAFSHLTKGCDPIQLARALTYVSKPGGPAPFARRLFHMTIVTSQLYSYTVCNLKGNRMAHVRHPPSTG